jgi:site-specific recombinase XerD
MGLRWRKLRKFEEYVHSTTKRNSNQKLGEKTKEGIFALAKYLESAKSGLGVDELRIKYKKYLDTRNHPVARYTLWLYLKHVGYNDDIIKKVVDFKKKKPTSLSDSEKLAQMVLTKKELTYLVENIKNDRDKLIVKFLYDTGARVSEMTNLQVRDIDLEICEAQLMGKGRKPRVVYFQASTAKMLKEYIFSKEDQNPNAILFGIKPITVWYHLKRYGKELLSRDLRPHMLRHSRLQHMADEGVDSFLIKSYAGHSNIATTQIYVKNSKFQRKLAFNKAGDIWEKS